MGKRILVVDDDRDILDLLEYNLEKEGFHVRTLDESSHALEVAKKYNPDLIVLDIMMPAPNGIELCKLFREKPSFRDTYIFFLTARSEFYFQEAAFDTGGDDFIEKIVGMRSLTHKINSVLIDNYIIRKCIHEIQLGPLRVNRRKSTVRMGAKEFTRSKPEMELLFFLAQNHDKAVAGNYLLNNIWGSDTFSVAHSVDTYIQNLSTKLGHGWIVPMSGDRYRLRVV
jgi:two-component system, OmpR family, alkaline phosphatase synthesis response regulator PhoP